MMTRPWQAALCVFAASLFTVISAVAQDTKRWIQPHFPADPKALFDAASSVTPTKGTDVVVLYEEQTYTFDNDGKSVSTNYQVYKILTEAGVSGWDNLSADWEPWHEQRPTLQARVIGTDKLSHILDQKTITDSPASDSDEEVYGDQRVVRAPLPAVAVGAVIETEVTTKETAPLFSAGTVRRCPFGSGVPVQETHLVLDAPASLPLKYQAQLLPDLQVERAEKGGRVHIDFHQGPLEAIEIQDSYLPSTQSVFPRVTFATGASWQAVASAYSASVDGQIRLGAAGDRAMQLTHDKPTSDEKIAALIQFLSKDVRYTGVEFDESGIIPHPPEETLKKQYGDCKDKATLLVSMLRTIGIPANVALLRVASREDVLPTLPGMGVFDHAIVYVPGPPAYWIDVTDDYARLGQLPARDQGRFALIAQPDTFALTQTPVSPSSANRLYERREFYLADNGPARVVEISKPQGVFESGYRSAYPSADHKETRKKLTEYVKTEYLADKLTKLEFTNPKDLSRPFQLTLEATPAKRGFTDLNSAVVAIRRETLFYELPDELQQAKPEVSKVKDTEAERTPKPPRSADYQLAEAFVSEWDYLVTPPPGFRARPLPENKKEAVGPAVYTQEFSVDADGNLHAKLTFDTLKRQFTVAEADEMRKKIVELKSAQPILLLLEPVSQGLLNEGKVKESFQASRNLISQHPNQAIYHLRLANYLLQAGMGMAAREECQNAVVLEPKSALAHKTLGDILEFDLVGRKFRRGSDIAGAVKAYRAAQQLDSDDYELTANLAVALEYSSEGERYGPGSKLEEAILEYRKLTEDQIQNLGFKNNLAFALFYSGKLAEARQEAEKLNPQPRALIVAAESIVNGSQAGLALARKFTGDEAEVKSTVKTAGDMAMRYRAYPTAADLLESGASGSNSASTMGLASMLRKARNRADIKFKDDPAGIVERLYVEAIDGKLTPQSSLAFYSKNAVIINKRQDSDEFKKAADQVRGLRAMLIRQGLPLDAMLDVIISAIQLSTEGDDTDGYRVTLRAPGSANIAQFVVKEDGHYKLLDTAEKPNAIGLEVLDRLKSNNLAGARILLDWIRESQHLTGGDDSLSGQALPRMWTKGKEVDARQLKLAAAALLCQTKSTAADGAAILEPALLNADNDVEKLNISLALLEAYSSLEDYTKQYSLATSLAQNHPDSKRLFMDRESALRGLGRFSEVNDLAMKWREHEPTDLDALRAVVKAETAAGNYSLAVEQTQKILASDKGEAHDYNGMAWLSLFTGKTDTTALEAATKAVQLTKSSPYALHTLGCVYAELGRTKEAREVLIQAMDQLSLDEPDDNYWYAFGRISEQYGEKQSAIRDYQSVKKPKLSRQIPDSSYKLAQMRLVAIDGKELPPPR